MIIKKVLCIEDSIEKYMAVFRFLRDQNVEQTEWVTNAENEIKKFEEAEKTGTRFDLILSDMHFDFFGEYD